MATLCLPISSVRLWHVECLIRPYGALQRQSTEFDLSHRDLSHSRPLDVHKWSDFPEVNSWVNTLWDEHMAAHFPTSTAGKKPKQTTKNMFKVLLLDLYVAWLEDPALCIGFSRTDKDYAVGSRYNALFISDKIIKVLDACIAAGLIEQHLGSEAAGKVTRVWPTERLVGLFRKAVFPDFMIDTYEGRETVVLNGYDLDKDDDLADIDGKDGEKPTALAYDDSDAPAIIPSRQLLKEYNALLRDTFVDLGCAEQAYVERQQWDKRTKQHVKRRVSLRHDNKFVRRIFYRGSWELGGRFHGGWWQQIPSELRRYIMIDDEATQEVDFSGFHVALSYGLEGLQCPRDPYRLPVTNEGLDAEQQRKDVKQLALTAINAKDRPSAYSAFRNEKNKERSGQPGKEKVSYTDKLLDTLLDGFLDFNSPISHYVCTDKGVELMALDGRITAHIIRVSTDQGIPILTVHDSYIVPAQHERQLEAAMTEACEKELGIRGFTVKGEKLTPNRAVAITTGPYSHDKRFALDAIDSFAEKTVRVDGYTKRLSRWRAFKERHDSNSE